jgi:uncharacterized protein YecT (DUF1311 family)
MLKPGTHLLPTRTNFGALAILFVCLLRNPCSAQSFDCSKAATEVEKTICHSPSLASLDSEMGDAYVALLGSSAAGEKGALRDAQRQWIGKRNTECTRPGTASQESCLKELTGSRRDELQEQLRKKLGLSQMALAWVTSYSSPRDIRAYADDVKDRFGDCHSVSPTLSAKFASLAPAPYERLFSIAAHQCDAVLRVYLSCPAKQACSELLILEDTAKRQARVLSKLEEESRTGNSSGIFVPVAFTKNGGNIILKAWMGSPGAGGGLVNYGYEIMPRDGGTTQRNALAPNGAAFYSDFGMVAYTKDSKKLPVFTQPGPQSNDGLLVVKDLATMKERPVLEESDTTFTILRADEKNHTLTIRATQHAFSASCPRDQEDSLLCSKKTTRERQIPLP